MSIEVEPSKNYPGRISIRHRLHEDSNATTVIDLTSEDVDDLALKLDELNR